MSVPARRPVSFGLRSWLATPALFATSASQGRWRLATHLGLIDDLLLDAAKGDARIVICMPPRLWDNVEGSTDRIGRASSPRKGRVTGISLQRDDLHPGLTRGRVRRPTPCRPRAGRPEPEWMSTFPHRLGTFPDALVDRFY